MIQSTNERAVRHAAFEQYGRGRIDTIQRVEPGAWQITLTSGEVAWAIVQGDGAIRIDPE